MKPLILAAALALIASPALAHPGDHSEVAGPLDALAHLGTSPFHIALALGALLAGGAAVMTARRLKARKVR